MTIHNIKTMTIHASKLKAIKRNILKSIRPVIMTDKIEDTLKDDVYNAEDDIIFSMPLTEITNDAIKTIYGINTRKTVNSNYYKETSILLHEILISFGFQRLETKTKSSLKDNKTYTLYKAQINSESYKCYKDALIDEHNKHNMPTIHSFSYINDIIHINYNSRNTSHCRFYNEFTNTENKVHKIREKKITALNNGCKWYEIDRINSCIQHIAYTQKCTKILSLIANDKFIVSKKNESRSEVKERVIKWIYTYYSDKKDITLSYKMNCLNKLRTYLQRLKIKDNEIDAFIDYFGNNKSIDSLYKCEDDFRRIASTYRNVICIHDCICVMDTELAYEILNMLQSNGHIVKIEEKRTI